MSICLAAKLFVSVFQSQCRVAQFASLTHQPYIRSFSHPLNSDMMATVPKTMKGVLVQRPGGVEVLEYKNDLPVPVPQYGELLIKNEFTGVNYIDT
jgi:hypothetical protein